MKKLLFYILFLTSVHAFAQNEQLAYNYFEKGEYEKALVLYQDLEKAQPYNTFFTQKMAACYQQLQQYDKAAAVLKAKLERTKQPLLLVDLGYSAQLQKDTAGAEKYFNQAIAEITKNPSHVYGIANAFEQKVLIPQALKAYDAATAANPSMNFDYQTALLEGQQGNLNKMIDKLLAYAYNNPQNLIMVQNQLSRFMDEDGSDTFNDMLRKTLLVNTQKNQDIFWNQFLSWYFVQQKDYAKAFIQEKAIYKREPQMLYNIVSLARMAVEDEENITAREILNFLLKATTQPEVILDAQYQLLKIDIADGKEDPKVIKQRITDLLAENGVSPYTLDIQILKADFEAFTMKDTKAATATLDAALKLQLNKYQVAEVKMKLSDVLLLDEKFNQAIIYYAQVEEDLKNDPVGHMASFKMARSSYYKGDFDWAQKQLKVLKSNASQLIANDALEIYLLIIDNTAEDSLQTALKKFAKADFKLYQNKKAEALVDFQQLIATDKTESIQDITLLRIGELYEAQGQHDLALKAYNEIIEKYKDGIYVDEALFFSAEIYQKLNDPEKAKALYEKVIFDHEDSIYYVEARKQYRQLRGDTSS